MKRSRLKKSGMKRKHLLRKFAIDYLEKPFGWKSPMVSRKSEFAVDETDAKEWAKIIAKEKNTVPLSVEIRKLPRKEWF